MISRRSVVIANEIRLKRSQHQGTFWVVEGRDDRLLCQRFFDPASCKIVVAEDKARVCDVVRILDQGGFAGVIGLVDSDFDRIEGRAAISPNIVFTDLHDLECMLLRSTALEALLTEFGSREKLERFNQDIRETLLAAASPIGHLRLYSERCGLALRFDGLNYSRCIDEQSLEISERALVDEVKNRSNRPDIPVETLLGAIGEIEARADDPWQICVGTDLLGILSIGLRRTLGNNTAGSVRDENLRRALRLAYTADEFAETELRQLLKGWEANNAPFKILG